MKPSGIILAAGESRRMGRDKALLGFRGATFLSHLISLLMPRVRPLIVVLGHHADEIQATMPALPGLQVAVNPEYRLGMLSSLQAGIRALPPQAAAALITLVDLPAVRETTVESLLEVFQESDQLLAIPRCGDRRGHPIIAARPILDELLELSADRSPKDVIRRHHSETVFVDVDDPGVLQDVDLPSEYEQLTQSL